VVLKPEVTKMTAVLLEAARLSGHDEQVLHHASTPSRVAPGVRAAVDRYFGF